MTGPRLLLGLLALLPLHTAAGRHTLHHRLGTSSAWSPRGIITIDEAGTSTYQDVTGKDRPWDALGGLEDVSSDLYQLALTPEGTASVGLDSPMTFARACLLATNSAESITIHQSATGVQSEPYAIGYDLIGLDASKLASSGCPAESLPVKAPREPLSIQVIVPEAPLSPLPPSPPPVKADGTLVQEGEEPPKEKSFLAKYWMYLLPVVLLMAIPTEMADSANEDEEGGGDENPFQAGVQKAAGKGAVKVGGAGGGSGAGVRKR